MQILKTLDTLERSDAYEAWRRSHKDSFWVHVFQMQDDENKDTWQIGYYNDDDTITTFIIEKGEISAAQDSEVFKEPDKKLFGLERANIKIEMEQAIAIARKLHGEKYARHPIMKQFVILQNLNGKDLYNVTFVTQTLNTINVRVSATDGSVIEEKMTSIMDFRAKE